jgi:CheY-like chemotaxis protein
MAAAANTKWVQGVTRRILFVDDEPHVLDALERQLRKQFEVTTAEGPLQGLQAIEKGGPFAVVVSDLRMPVMDGIQFLAKTKQACPDSIRIVLSGQGDFAAVIDAVNEGSIFRFLTKPCATDQLAKTLLAALEQYRLVQAERELLEHTLSGCIEVLSEILSLMNPSAFSRSHRIRRYVKHMTSQLGLPDAWQYEVAAMLSQIGSVTISPDVIEKVYSGFPLSNSEAEAFASQYEVAGRLLARIPRLEEIARIVAGQHLPTGAASDCKTLGSMEIGIQMLQIASSFDQGLVRGLTRDGILSEIKAQRKYSTELITAMRTAEIPQFGGQARSMKLHDMRCGMIIDGEVRSTNGILLYTKGQEVTETLIDRLKNFAGSMGIVEPISVLVPQTQGSDIKVTVSPGFRAPRANSEASHLQPLP